MPHINKSRIKARGHFAHFGQIDVAHGKTGIRPLTMQLHQEFIAQHGERHLACLRTNNEIYAQR